MLYCTYMHPYIYAVSRMEISEVLPQLLCSEPVLPSSSLSYADFTGIGTPLKSILNKKSGRPKFSFSKMRRTLNLLTFSRIRLNKRKILIKRILVK